MNEVAIDQNPNIRTRLSQSSPVRDSVASGERIPRRKPVYPMSAERELARVAVGVAAIINRNLKPMIERVMNLYDAAEDKRVRADAKWSMDDGIGALLEECENEIQSEIDGAKLVKSVGRVGKVAQRLSVKDWRALVEEVTGNEISEPFYMETMDDLMNKWVADSVSYIGSLPQTALGKVHEIIVWGYTTNQPRINIYRRLEQVLGMTRKHARLIATDQMGTLNCRMTEYEHKSLGVTHYKWTARHDTRVRPCHASFNNKIFAWNNPPAEWYPTKRKGYVFTGNYFHPGEAINCRCTAKPVFNDIDTAAAYIMSQKVGR